MCKPALSIIYGSLCVGRQWRIKISYSVIPDLWLLTVHLEEVIQIDDNYCLRRERKHEDKTIFIFFVH